MKMLFLAGQGNFDGFASEEESRFDGNQIRKGGAPRAEDPPAAIAETGKREKAKSDRRQTLRSDGNSTKHCHFASHKSFFELLATTTTLSTRRKAPLRDFVIKGTKSDDWKLHHFCRKLLVGRLAVWPSGDLGE